MWINIKHKQPPLYTQVLQLHQNGEVSAKFQGDNRPDSPIVAWQHIK